MVYGIPEFRLPKALVASEAGVLESMGVNFEMSFLVGRTRRLSSLLGEDGFDAVFVGTGAGLPKFMEIPGENLVGVFSANEYLTRTNLMKAYVKGKAATPLYPSRRVAVLGGRQRGHGRSANGAQAGRRRSTRPLPSHKRGNAGSRRGSDPRHGRRHPF